MPAHAPHKRLAAPWPVVLLLAPVGLLAVLGILSLRQDRVLVQEEARDQARLIAATLAREFQARMEVEIAGYVAAARVAFADHAADSGDPALIRSSTNDAAARWSRDHPDIPLEKQPQSVCVLNDRGLVDPRDYPAVAAPPVWLARAPAQDLALWQAAVDATQAGRLVAALEQWRSLSTHTNVDLAANARFQGMWLAGSGGDDETLGLLSLAREFPEVRTASGMPLADLALIRSICSASAVVLNNDLVWEVRRRVSDHPSVFTVDVLDAMEARSRVQAPSLLPAVQALRTMHEASERARSLLRVLLEAGAVSPGVRALDSGTSRCLALIATPGTRPEIASQGAGTNLLVLLVPIRIVDDATQVLVGRAQAGGPAYLRAFVRLDRYSPGESAGLSGRDEVLAAANSSFMSASGPIPFTVEVVLTDRNRLMARQRQRTALFSALVVAAAGVAALGAWWMQRNLRRQLLLNDAKSNFVSSVSHELRAPIASVRLMAEGLEHGRITEPSRQNTYFKLIGQECRRLSALVENVLDVSRIEQGRKQYEFEPIDLPALLHSTVSLMEPMAIERGCTLRPVLQASAADNGSPPQYPCLADGKAIQQALVNLIDNALKHSPPGASVRVGLQGNPPVTLPSKSGGSRDPVGPLTPAPGRLHLFVEDDGEGIPPEEHRRIFERFYRRGSELRRETQGVGIGLCIVQHIAEAHGGRVLVRSAVGQGSRFTVELPWNAS